MNRREIIAKELIKAGLRGEPTGLLMRELYRECGMSSSEAKKEELKTRPRKVG